MPFMGTHRWSIGEGMMAVAALAVALAVLGVGATAVLGVSLVPMFLAPRDRRFTAACWGLVAGPPTFLVLMHYIIWGIVRARLGTRPMTLSDPYLLNMNPTPAIRGGLAILEASEVPLISSAPLTLALVIAHSCVGWKKSEDLWRSVRLIIGLPCAWMLGYLALTTGP